MNAESFEKLESAFDHAARLSPEAQVDFLERLGEHDGGVAHTLRELLTHDTDGVEEEIRRLVRTVIADAGGEAADAPRRIGGYTLLGVIAEGGFGVVHLAEQPAPVHRLVAVKVIKPGMDTRQVLARFNDERQALALMDHPAVVAAIDAGTTTDGRPYVVMPLVPGLPITDYARERALTVVERCRLLLTLCAGVQHAHNKGVVHRDLKPSNLLVYSADGHPQVKIIDFGLAKALSSPLTPHATVTVEGQVVGTPEYMAPEQATEQPTDTRTDVYALGAVLYELLADRPPFLPDELRAGGRDGLRKTLRERTPAAPSTVATTRLPRELDWITLRCLEKEPSRRYQTADALAADLERFCEGRAVQAGPQARLYRLYRFGQRYRWPLAAAAIAAASLIAGAGIAVGYAVKAQSDRRRAEQVAQLTRNILTGVDPTIAQGRDPELLIAMLNQSSTILDRPGADGLDPRVEQDLCETFALAYFAVGQYAEATTYARRSDALIKRLEGPDSLHRLETLRILLRGETYAAQIADQRGALQTSIPAEMRRIVAQSAPGDEPVALKTDLVIASLTSAADDDQLKRLIDRCETVFGPASTQTIQAMRLLARRLADERKPEGRTLIEEARRRALDKFGPDAAITHSHVAVELMAAQFLGAPPQEVYDLGAARIPDAERVLGWRHPGIAAAHQNHAQIALQLGKCDEALESYTAALRTETAARTENSGMAQWICCNLALAALRCNRWDTYLECESRLWRIEPQGPHVAWETVVEIIPILHQRGESARINRWMTILDRAAPTQAAALRARLNIN